LSMALFGVKTGYSGLGGLPQSGRRHLKDVVSN
jgi:hypothetical protein